jgi:exopolysaccharide biosynthesis polyprenyl glycosylphosphotransferase
MIRERTDLIRNILYAADLLAVSVNFFFAYLFLIHFESLRLIGDLAGVDTIRMPDEPGLYLQAYWLALVLWAIVLRNQGGYHNLRIQTYGKVALKIFIGGVIFFVSFTSFAFLFKYIFLSRIYMVIYTVTCVALLCANRLIVLWAAHALRSRGLNAYNILIVGTGRRAQEFLSLTVKRKEWGYRIVGFLDKDPKMLGKNISEYQVLGSLDDLPKILESRVIDEVVFVVPRSWLPTIEKCILYCEAVGVPATLATDFFDLEIASGVPKVLDGFTYLTFETSRLKDAELVVKRTVDILSSFIILVLCLPLFGVIAAAIRLEGAGPIFFGQIRSGLNGRRFKLYKFRSMVPDAEKRLAELRTHNEMTGPVFKMTNDPRLTKVGRILRKTSLDEFPQFWNVLKGDMSLVGPRPPIPKEVEQYEPWQRRRLSMKPGITCIWQVSGRNKIGFEDWMKMDLLYIDRWSLWLDLKIMALTFRAVLKMTGK